MFKSLKIKEICFGIFAEFWALGGPSFSDTKATKNLSQYFIVADLTGNKPQMVHAFSDVLSDKIAGQVLLQTFPNAPYSFQAGGESFEVPYVADYGIGSINLDLSSSMFCPYLADI